MITELLFENEAGMKVHMSIPMYTSSEEFECWEEVQFKVLGTNINYTTDMCFEFYDIVSLRDCLADFEKKENFVWQSTDNELTIKYNRLNLGGGSLLFSVNKKYQEKIELQLVMDVTYNNITRELSKIEKFLTYNKDFHTD